MKYIRTKDGIYETIDYDQLPNNLKKQLDEREHSCMKDYKKMGVFVKMKQGTLIISNIQPILLFAVQKQADTIEELCDVYVIIPKDRKSKPYTVDTLSVFDDFEDVLKHNDIYLSIWVDALLKPVAKMNEKGESCLI